ncbi:MAG TPA: hypothetical protein VFE14_13185 [Micromonosporaceae bacterium]|jgi:hypothetical protein|nr:hypothetical protein [Micromonosporaceae bacterium]
MTSQYYVPYGWPVDEPRPPKPVVVTVAVALTYLGVLVSGLKAAGELAMTLAYRTDIVALLQEQQRFQRNDNNGMDMQTFLNAYVTGIPVVLLVAWLAGGVAAVICANRATRGSNGARITLAVLAGVFALGSVCAGVFTPVSVLSGHRSSSTANIGTLWTLFSIVLGLVLAAVAVTILILLLVPPARRYFSPGPGRRFATDG